METKLKWLEEEKEGDKIGRKGENQQKLDPRKALLSSRNSAPTKQYKYWIDVQDLSNLIKDTLTGLQLMLEGEDTQSDESSNSSGQQ